jgi:hypothetical protein
MVQPGTARHQGESKELARNQKEKIIGRKKRLRSFHSLICVKWKWC